MRSSSRASASSPAWAKASTRISRRSRPARRRPPTPRPSRRSRCIRSWPPNYDNQIPKKSDQRQMEPWQRLGIYAAGLALDAAGAKERCGPEEPHAPHRGGRRRRARLCGRRADPHRAAPGRRSGRLPQRAPDGRPAADACSWPSSRTCSPATSPSCTASPARRAPSWARKRPASTRSGSPQARIAVGPERDLSRRRRLQRRAAGRAPASTRWAASCGTAPSGRSSSAPGRAAASSSAPAPPSWCSNRAQHARRARRDAPRRRCTAVASDRQPARSRAASRPPLAESRRAGVGGEARPRRLRRHGRPAGSPARSATPLSGGFAAEARVVACRRHRRPHHGGAAAPCRSRARGRAPIAPGAGPRRARDLRRPLARRGRDPRRRRHRDGRTTHGAHRRKGPPPRRRHRHGHRHLARRRARTTTGRR